MPQSERHEGWLPGFRRSVRYLRPHRRPLAAGLILALGVSLFYTFSISSVVPLLKVMFSEHEPLLVWMHRVEAERRLGIHTVADLPDSPEGFRVSGVRGDQRTVLGIPVGARPADGGGGALTVGDSVAAIDGATVGSYELFDRIARHPTRELAGVRVVAADGRATEVRLPLAPPRRWWLVAERIVGLLPHGQDAESRTAALAVIMCGLVLMAVLGGVCRFLNEGLVAVAVQRAMHDLRTGLGAHVLRLPMDWYSRHPHGDALSRFSTDIAKIEVGLTTVFGKTIREPLKAVGVLALTLFIDWRLLLVAAIGVPVGGLVMRTFGRRIKHAQRRASQSWGRLLDQLGERLGGIRVVKAYSMENAEAQRFEREGRRLTRAQTHVELIDAATNPSLEVLAMVAIAGFVLYGGALVFHAQIEANLFFAAVVCLAGIFDPVRKMGNVNNRVQAAEASAARLFELLDLPEEGVTSPVAAGHGGNGRRSAEPGGPGVLRFEREITFDGVTFAYPANPTTNVLTDVTFGVSRGQVVALVGPNGSGKTTLVSLLLRFFEPTSGRILIDGVDVADVPLDVLRPLFGLVTQDTVIFSDTVRSNIAYGSGGATDDEIERAARMAHADDFIRELRSEGPAGTATGYNAMINARTLSGGQKQRIAIARAILRDPPVLVFDEATSQVDADSERKIQEALDDVIVGRTTFVIAHRFSTIQRADVIVVLEEGRVAGIGRHDELVQTCPRYRTLYATQLAAAPV